MIQKLGMDLQMAAKQLPIEKYAAAYKSALVRMQRFLEADVLIPDPHPYNLALTDDGGWACLQSICLVWALFS